MTSISNTDGTKDRNEEKATDPYEKERDPAEKDVGEAEITFEEKDAFLLEAGNIVLDLISLQKKIENEKINLTSALQ